MAPAASLISDISRHPPAVRVRSAPACATPARLRSRRRSSCRCSPSPVIAATHVRGPLTVVLGGVRADTRGPSRTRETRLTTPAPAVGQPSVAVELEPDAAGSPSSTPSGSASLSTSSRPKPPRCWCVRTEGRTPGRCRPPRRALRLASARTCTSIGRGGAPSVPDAVGHKLGEEEADGLALLGELDVEAAQLRSRTRCGVVLAGEAELQGLTHRSALRTYRFLRGSATPPSGAKHDAGTTRPKIIRLGLPSGGKNDGGWAKWKRAHATSGWTERTR